MFKSTSSLPLWRSFACVATLPLVLLAAVNWMAGPAPAAVEVVDAFIAARAARDLRTVAALVPSEASVVDTAHATAVSGDGWYQLLPLAEVLEVGPRHLENNGDVAWSELVLDDGRPSWENNLNWFVGDNTALASNPVIQHDAPSIVRTRTMRATVTGAGITRLELGRPDDLNGPARRRRPRAGRPDLHWRGVGARLSRASYVCHPGRYPRPRHVRPRPLAAPTRLPGIRSARERLRAIPTTAVAHRRAFLRTEGGAPALPGRRAHAGDNPRGPAGFMSQPG